MTIKRFLQLGALMAALAGGASASQLGTAFKYQGQLSFRGVPASGSYDMKFALYALPTTGTAMFPVLTNLDVTVANGVFDVMLDFYDPPFNGSATWLEVSVRTNGKGAFQALSPRQPMSPVPNAIYASVAKDAVTAYMAYGVATDVITGPGIATNQVVKKLNGLSDLVTLAAGANLSLSPSGNTITLSSPGDWHMSGNSGTTAGTHFVGTTDNRPLELRANNLQTLWMQGNAAGHNVVAGGPGNYVLAGMTGATISGGKDNTFDTGGNFSTISGGLNNQVYMGGASVIGGGRDNFLGSSEVATIGGGGLNRIWDGAWAATIAGGSNNTIETYSVHATISGGVGNRVGDGWQNGATGATIGGGYFNRVTSNAHNSTVSGGEYNRVERAATHAAIPGGYSNQVSGDYGLAAGRRAHAAHSGAFVWADSQNAECKSDRDNQFKVRAAGGMYILAQSAGLSPAACRIESSTANGVGLFVSQTSSDANVVIANPGTGDQLKCYNGPGGGTVVFKVDNDGDVTGKTFTPSSDRNMKENFTAVDPQTVLARVAGLPISRWNFKADEILHIGPMAQDFHAAFGVGPDEKHIATVDADGVALAAIQGLNQKINERDARIQELEARLVKLERLMNGKTGGVQ